MVPAFLGHQTDAQRAAELWKRSRRSGGGSPLMRHSFPRAKRSCGQPGRHERLVADEQLDRSGEQ